MIDRLVALLAAPQPSSPTLVKARALLSKLQADTGTPALWLAMAQALHGGVIKNRPTPSSEAVLCFWRPCSAAGLTRPGASASRAACWSMPCKSRAWSAKPTC
ncbi:hypothetical protein [Ideonella paludis]|uniref:hypothetical protein n=1 Tax=Ideonella paludis TaxID=1233411 RepID=UPI003625D6D7